MLLLIFGHLCHQVEASRVRVHRDHHGETVLRRTWQGISVGDGGGDVDAPSNAQVPNDHLRKGRRASERKGAEGRANKQQKKGGGMINRKACQSHALGRGIPAPLGQQGQQPWGSLGV